MAMAWARIRSGARFCSIRNVTAVFRHCGLISTSTTASMADPGKKTASVMYLTPDSVDGVEMDPGTGSSLEDLFNKNFTLCFDNVISTIGCHDFSPFSKEIFAKVMTIGYRQGVEKGRYFRFDPTTILVKRLNEKVLEVGVPISQLIQNAEVQKSIYKDHVIGPFANMVLTLCLKAVFVDPHTGVPKMEECYKEVLDLLYRAQTGKWWSSLDEILAHPLFQLVEKKIACLSLAHMWLNGSKVGPPHGVRSTPVRIRTTQTPQAFLAEYKNNDFYHKAYTISHVGSEIMVAESVNQADWRQYFILNNCFGPHYKLQPILASGLKMDLTGAMVRQCRVIIFHFDDNNMDAYAAVLDSPTVKVAVINLDRVFSLSLSFFYTLKALGIPVEDVLDTVLC